MSFRSMKIPLGRPNCFHSSKNFPSWSKIWMRLLLRSPTNNLPVESIAIAWSSANSPLAVPFLPQALMNFPSFENLTMRALESPPCPSATKISPFGAVTTAEGRLIEGVRTVSCNSCLTEHEQDLSIRIELNDLMALVVFFLCVSHPHVAVFVDMHAVREHEHSRAKRFHRLAGPIKLEYRRKVRTGASALATSLENPDVAVAIDVDPGCGSPLPSVGEFRPTLIDAIRIVLSVGSRQHHDDHRDEGKYHPI